MISHVFFISVMTICMESIGIIGSDNGLSPDQHQAIIWTNVGILFIWPLGTNFSEILIKIDTFSFRKIHSKMSAKWLPFCHGLHVLTVNKHFNQDGKILQLSKCKVYSMAIYEYICYVTGSPSDNLNQWKQIKPRQFLMFLISVMTICMESIAATRPAHIAFQVPLKFNKTSQKLGNPLKEFDTSKRSDYPHPIHRSQ